MQEFTYFKCKVRFRGSVTIEVRAKTSGKAAKAGSLTRSQAAWRFFNICSSSIDTFTNESFPSDQTSKLQRIIAIRSVNKRLALRVPKQTSQLRNTFDMQQTGMLGEGNQR